MFRSQAIPLTSKSKVNTAAVLATMATTSRKTFHVDMELVSGMLEGYVGKEENTFCYRLNNRKRLLRSCGFSGAQALKSRYMRKYHTLPLAINSQRMSFSYPVYLLTRTGRRVPSSGLSRTNGLFTMSLTWMISTPSAGVRTNHDMIAVRKIFICMTENLFPTQE